VIKAELRVALMTGNGNGFIGCLRCFNLAL
jgi:hypothetical protein